MVFPRPLTLVILAAAALAAEAAGQAPPLPAFTPAAGARVDGIFAPYASLDRPGYAVGIVRGGQLVYAKGFGSANLDHRVPITPASVFNIASLSKQFTAAAVGILIRRGKLSLEDPVRRYIPELPAAAAAVRVKHLVYMTSGLPEYYTLPRPGGRDWSRDFFTVQDAIRAVVAAGRLEFPPGERWAYSNTNYQLLAEIVSRIDGTSFAEFSAREIFRPLGMRSTHVNDDLGRIVSGRATGYNEGDGGGYHRELRRSPHYGGSGVFTSVEDLARWDEGFRSHVLGGPELTALLLGRMRFRHDKTNDAFGLVWGSFRGRRTLWYEGGDLGFSSYMVRLPDDDLTVIVLANLGTARAADHARRVLEVLVPR